MRISLKFDACLTVDVEGRSGGLAVLWKEKLKCSVMNFPRNFVNLLIQDEVKGQWRLTCYYGYVEDEDKRGICQTFCGASLVIIMTCYPNKINKVFIHTLTGYVWAFVTLLVTVI